MLSIGVPPLAVWVEQGPGPILSQPLATGAVNAVAPHPSDPNIVYIASVNGGVWRSLIANHPSDGLDNDEDGTIDNEVAVWMPLTDRYGSLAATDVAFDPLDSTHNTLWASTGRFSSLNAESAPLIGLLKTTDGGLTWQNMGNASLQGKNLIRVLPAGFNDPGTNQPVVFAASIGGVTGDTGGLYRSSDGGQTFTQLGDAQGLPAGRVSDLVNDPIIPTTIYAAVAGQGVFRSVDWGYHWTDVGIPGGSDSVRFRLSFSRDSGMLWAARIHAATRDNKTGAELAEVSRYNPVAGSWTSFSYVPGIHAGLQGALHGSLVADPADGNIVYVGGDRDPHMFRGDLGLDVWFVIQAPGANNTSPHPDSRDMEFDANGNIVQADDGGVYRLVSPNSDADRRWVPLNTTLRVTETIHVAYDRLNDVFFAGTWDNGNIEQREPASWGWNQASRGDGGQMEVVNGFGQTIRYEGASKINFVDYDKDGNPIKENTPWVRRSFDRDNQLVAETALKLADPTTPSVRYSGLNTTDRGDTGWFYINPVAPDRILITGKTAAYESFDGGDTITPISGLSGPFGFAATGGRMAGVVNGDVAYLIANRQIYLRTTPFGAFNVTADYAPGAQLPWFVAIDPENWQTAFVVDLFGAKAQIYRTTDAGANWLDITGNLGGFLAADLLDSDKQINVLEVYREGDNLVLLAGGQGGVYRLRDPLAALAPADFRWRRFGTLLSRAPVADLEYYPAASTANGTHGDVLVAATFGRGVWAVRDAGALLTAATVLTVNGDEDFPGQNDTIRVQRDAASPGFLDIFLNNSSAAPDCRVESATLEEIVINALGGSDTIYIDSIDSGVKVTVNAGTGDDAIHVGSGSFASQIGEDITAGGGGGSDTLIIHNRSGRADGDIYTLTATSFTQQGAKTVTYSGLEGLTLDASDFSEFITVESTASTTPVAIYGGGRYDTIQLGNGSLDDLRGLVTIDGEVGWDTLGLIDGAATHGVTYTLTGTTIVRDGLDVAVYRGFEELVVRGPDQESRYNLDGTSPDATTSIYGGDARDVFSVNRPPSSLVVVDGGRPLSAPGDVLNVVGTATLAGIYRPHPSTPRGGTVTLDGQDVRFSDIESVSASMFSTLTFRPPAYQNGVDTIGIDSPGAGTNRLSGRFDDIPFADLTCENVDTMFIDMDANDSGFGGLGADQLTVDAGDMAAAGVNHLRVNAGVNSSGLPDVVDILGGAVNLDLGSQGYGAAFLALNVRNAGTLVNFDRDQQVPELTLESGAGVRVLAGTTGVARGSSTGLFHVADDATLNFVEQYTVHPGAAFSGGGRVLVDPFQTSFGLTIEDSLGIENLAVGMFGAVSVQKGTLTLGGMGSIAGRLELAPGASINLAGDFELNTGVFLFGNGALRIDPPGAGRRVLVNGSMDLRNLEVAGQGKLVVQSGTLDVSDRFLQTGGVTELAGGELRPMAPEGIELRGGVLAGTGAILGNVTNGARFAPGLSPGSLDIVGNYTQTASGVLDIQLGGLDPGTGFDQVRITGSAVLDGTLQLSVLDPFQPALGQNFDVLSFKAHGGDFAAIHGADLGGGLVLQPILTDTHLVLRVAPPFEAHFDFGTKKSPVQTGYTRVTERTAYSNTRHYGWQSGRIFSADRHVKGASALDRDLNYARQGTFAVDVPNGTYSVTLRLGDLGATARDLMGVSLEGVAVDPVSTKAKEVLAQTYVVAVADGQLNIDLRDLGGKDKNVSITALDVAAVAPDQTPPTMTIDQASGQIDPTGVSPILFAVTFSEPVAGFTADDIVLQGTAPGPLKAAVTGRGTTYQVAVSGMTAGGTVVVDVAPGAAADMSNNPSLAPTLTDSSVTYYMPVGKFDFGTPTSPVEQGYRRVSSKTVYSSTLGYGWQGGKITSAERMTGSRLDRDLNLTSLGTFVLNVPNGDYLVTMRLGDLGRTAHDQMGVFVEGTQVDTVSTPARSVVPREYRVTISDGQLTVLLQDLGGADPDAAIASLAVFSLPPTLQSGGQGLASRAVDEVLRADFAGMKAQADLLCHGPMGEGVRSRKSRGPRRV
jgi:fibronectin type 3 domain-containing protein